MDVDERRLDELMAESQDLQADALRDVRSTRRDLRAVGDELSRRPVDPDRVRAVDAAPWRREAWAWAPWPRAVCSAPRWGR
jgi:hypothetical protein